MVVFSHQKLVFINTWSYRSFKENYMLGQLLFKKYLYSYHNISSQLIYIH